MRDRPTDKQADTDQHLNMSSSKLAFAHEREDMKIKNRRGKNDYKMGGYQRPGSLLKQICESMRCMRSFFFWVINDPGEGLIHEEKWKLYEREKNELDRE